MLISIIDERLVGTNIIFRGYRYGWILFIDKTESCPRPTVREPDLEQMLKLE
jgi:hypothetical protein